MMKTRKIGELTVSEIGMGCMGFSHGYGQIPEESYSIKAIQMAHDYGCTFFDTAETYGNVLYFPGHNEMLLGKAVKDFRKDVILATKCHLKTEEYEECGKDVYKLVRKHLDASMEKIGTDYIDLYYLHRVNEDIPMDEYAEVMGRLIKEGLIRGWGMSAVSADLIERVHAITPVTAVQNLYNMLERDAEKDVLPFCEANGIGMVPFSPVASGFLSGTVSKDNKFEGDDVRKWVPQFNPANAEANQPILDMLDGYATAKNATKAQISLAWMLKKYKCIVPIPGSKNQGRILENLGASNVELTDEEFTNLDNALNTFTVYGHRGQIESEQENFGKNWQKAINKTN